MVLIAAALASQPSLLVLDEPCQGLDILNRQRMLTVVNRICESTSMSFVYITHHYEEVLPSVGHALHLKDRRAVFNGPIDGYNPSSYHDKL
jgi:iron complex transport system ATP-binding protein